MKKKVLSLVAAAAFTVTFASASAGVFLPQTQKWIYSNGDEVPAGQQPRCNNDPTPECARLHELVDGEWQPLPGNSNARFGDRLP